MHWGEDVMEVAKVGILLEYDNSDNIWLYPYLSTSFHMDMDETAPDNGRKCCPLETACHRGQSFVGKGEEAEVCE